MNIRPITENDIEAFNAVVGAVARERDYLTFLDCPPMDGTREFVLDNIKNHHPQFLALDGEAVVGWCDITPPSTREVHRHVGVLGIGLLPPYRGRGLGRQLMQAALDAARAKGLTRIELKVRATNTRARALYEKMGFVLEGTLRRDWCVDGQCYDTHVMGLVWG
jgi:ribosomal protein S18 acetylase RimI-like enzyme